MENFRMPSPPNSSFFETLRPLTMFAWTVMVVLSPFAIAQLAPNGNHYAGRASDTGAGGSAVDATGNLPQTIMFDLPPARGDIPLPLQVVYGGQRLGAAGVGWDVPLSYLQQDATFAHRRPASAPDAAPVPRQHTSLSLLGQSSDLIAQGDLWVARLGTLELIVRKSGNVWLAYDGLGRTYTFEQPPSLPKTGLWLLKSIDGPDNSSVALTYQITSVALQGGTGWEIDLAHIAYNYHGLDSSPQLNCAKNDIVLSWSSAADSKGPLDISILDDIVLARVNTLAQVDIKARGSCFTAPVSLRHYVFNYLPDVDTGQPQLASVSLFGRGGTPEGATALPIAAWQYGTATSKAGDGSRQLRYGSPKLIRLPDGTLTNEVSATNIDSSASVPESGDAYGMSQTVADFTGHGRTDLVFRKNGRLWIAKGGPGPDSTSTFGAGEVESLVPLSDDTFKGNSISTQSLTSRRYDYATRNTTDVWRQAIDINGDGRLDIIDAAEEADHWVVYLNTPGGPSGVKWERRSFSIAKLRGLMRTSGHNIDGNHLPLSRQSTGIRIAVDQCWRWDGSKWNPYSEGFSNHRLCPGSANKLEAKGAEFTYIEWELADVNGDGYPDFVFDSTPVDFQVTPPPSTPKPNKGAVQGAAKVWLPFAPSSTNHLEVALNVLGVRFDTDRDVFAQPIMLLVPSLPEWSVLIGEWTCPVLNINDACADSTHLVEKVGLADVNGDGLIDLVVGQTAYLGSFSGHTPAFSPVFLSLPTIGFPGINQPAFLASQINDHDAQCQVGKPQTPTTTQTQGFRDLTGDGIPDYYDASSNSFPASPGIPQVWIGTGTGFRGPVPIVTGGVNFQFSHETESCDGKSSRTDGGLYDIDGDGKPDIVGVIPNKNSFIVTELTGGRVQGNPESGRIIRITNDAGAQTNVSYSSVKQFGDDLLPFPEIVVTSVSTVGTHNLGGSLDGTNYAYGYGVMIYNSALDRFVFPGYKTRIAVQTYKVPRQPIGSDKANLQVAGGPSPVEVLMGVPTITNMIELEPFANSMSMQQRWLREVSAGQVSKVLTLRASTNTNPWSLFFVDPNDSRVIGETKYTWDSKIFETPAISSANPIDCYDIVDPYDYQRTLASLNSQAVDICRTHGFPFHSAATTWRGDAPPPSEKNIQTGTQTLSVDAFGRTLSTHYKNDLFRSDDDVCVDNVYAAPVNPYPRVLSAMSSRRIYACGENNTLASESWLYDNLPPYSVAKGHITSHIIDRRATDTGAVLKSILDYNTSWDDYGNIASIRSQRDNALRTLTFTYDAFSLVPTHVSRDATGVPSSAVDVAYDPVSMQRRVMTDANKNQYGVDYDGYGRAIRATMTPFGSSQGVLSSTSYLGFDGKDSEGERISQTLYPDPVDPGSVSIAPGRTTVAHFDELGRIFRTDVSLGSDYANQTVISRWKAFDGAGRLSFAATPFPATESADKAYGQSFFYKDTGNIDCIVSSRGHLNFIVTSTNVTSEQFPTCYQQSYSGHVARFDVKDATSLDASSQQAGTVKRISKSAIGRTLSQSAFRGSTQLENEAFVYDRLGHWTSLTRFLDPQHNTGPVQWTLRRDSLGHATEVNEPEQNSRTYKYSDWGELFETDWTDGSTSHSVTQTYDSLSRLLTVDEHTNGITDPYAHLQYTYDTPVSLSPLVTPAFVTGQLASATSARGTVAFSYDSFERVNARTFTDEQKGVYVDKANYHTDGSLASLTFKLPDTGYTPETAQYSYDSAGRLRKVAYSDATGSRDIYAVSGIDVYGRVTAAQLGATSSQATFALGGRRLIQESMIHSSSGSRQTIFGQFDPLARELARQEISDGAASGPATKLAYDALGRLATANETDGNKSGFEWSFEYDALGNIENLTNKPRNSSTTLVYDSVDKDRVCRVNYADNLVGVFLNRLAEDLQHTSYLPCNVKYDGSGSILTEPARSGGPRQFRYYQSGKVRDISQGNKTAAFAYDPFGQLQTLDIDSPSGGRHDRHYGDLIELHYTSSNPGAYGNGSTKNTSFVTRNIPGPGGILARRHGATGDWVYTFGETRGNRASVTQNGSFVQKIDYQPYGAPSSSGAAVASADYTGYQWNGGDSLPEFGLARLGARVYDPEIGRFLSRDPLLAPQTATTSNPYAFAASDPWNGADPTGLCIGQECDYLNSLAPFGVGLLAWGIDELAGSGGGRHGSQAQQPTPLGPGPHTDGGIVLQNALIARGDKIPGNFSTDSLARNGFTVDEAHEMIHNSPEQDYKVDAWNAEIDKGEHYVRVGGLALAGGALLVAGGAVIAPLAAGATAATGTAAAGTVLTGAAALGPEAIDAADEFEAEAEVGLETVTSEAERWASEDRVKVVSRVLINGENLYGKNGYWANYFTNLDGNWGHAEIDALGKAYINVPTIGQNATMWVTRELCISCLTSGEAGELAGNVYKAYTQMGLQSLTIHTPSNSYLIEGESIVRWLTRF
jgi:RHS repeat-associated protein